MKTTTYKKHNSFASLDVKLPNEEKSIINKIIILKNNGTGSENFSRNFNTILDKVIRDLTNNSINPEEKNNFKLEKNVLAEISIMKDQDWLKYLVHRYRYEIYPKLNIIDEFPPCLQIEPSSICNYRCIFCFETDKTFTSKKNGHMGSMSLDLFKRIIDNVEGKIEFITLASRGEPLVSKNINEMLKYTRDKFLNLKLNTNASMLDEKKCHSILSGGVKTIIFSADAADEKLYSKLRVNGSLKKVLENIERFQKIRDTQYPNVKIISRVSGVRISKEQKFEKMKSFWGSLVDQVAFVDYNPWENTYLKEANDIKTPCSDLWRRMFIWWDGKANPCDTDYKSVLSTGNFSENNISDLWNSKAYNLLRNQHLNKLRLKVKPCQSCTVI
jgi:radical SAM protein with 4Fe4S-binding SPASM domain